MHFKTKKAIEMVPLYAIGTLWIIGGGGGGRLINKN